MIENKNIILLWLVLSNSLLLTAGGFQVNLQGQKQTGMGHCGTGLSLGASSAFFNPGAFAFTDGIQLELGVSFVNATINYLEPYPGIYTTQTINGVGTPFSFYSSFRIRDSTRWNLGLAVYTPFGSSIQYKDDWKGQFVIREMSLRTIFIQPTVGFRVNDKLGIGVGYVYGTGEFELRKGVPVQDKNGNYGEGLLKGKGSGHGFNAGIFIKPSESFSIGLNYRSSLKVEEENGQASFTVAPHLKDSFPDSTFSTTINLPQVISIGASIKVTEKSTFAIDINYVGWNVYDTLSFDFTINTKQLEDIHSAREYVDAFIFRLGYSYKYDERMTLRLGAYYDLSPVKEGYLTPETPDSDKLGITAGFSFRVSDNFGIDASILFVEGKARTDINKETEFGGTWKAMAVIPGVGLDFRF